jgi:hypothetical protein
MKTLLFLLLPFMLLGQTYDSVKKDIKSSAVAVSDVGKESLTSASKFLKEGKDFAVQTVHSMDTSSVSKQIYGDVKYVVKAIATNLGIATEKVYIVVTKKFFLEGVVGLIGNLAYCIVFFFIVKFLYKRLKNAILANADYSIPLGICSLIFVIVLVGALGSNLGSFSENVGKTFNPEYYTIQFIIDNLKTLVK